LFRKKQADKKTTLKNQACRGLDTSENPVRAIAGCDLLILLFEKQSQKIAACGSSFMGMDCPAGQFPQKQRGPTAPSLYQLRDA
jgi:hypothetical protein